MNETRKAAKRDRCRGQQSLAAYMARLICAGDTGAQVRGEKVSFDVFHLKSYNPANHDKAAAIDFHLLETKQRVIPLRLQHHEDTEGT